LKKSDLTGQMIQKPIFPLTIVLMKLQQQIIYARFYLQNLGKT